MKPEKAIEMFLTEYKKALELKHINQPMAYALYQTWQYVDKHEKGRRNNNA